MRCSNRARTRLRTAALVEVLEPRLQFSLFSVTTAAADGAGSLRQAIISANARANTKNPNGSADRIHFDIPGSGAHTITLVS